MLPNKVYISEGYNDLNSKLNGIIATKERQFKDDIEYVRVDIDYSKYVDSILQKKLLNRCKSGGMKELLDYTTGFRDGFKEAVKFLKFINYEEEGNNSI